MAQVIVVGGGLAGLSAAHTVLERGGNVLLLDKNSFLGGNSTKATSGINGAGTRTQRALGVPDTPEIFYEDSAHSARDMIRPHLTKVLTYHSGPAVEWLIDSFGLDLSLVGRLGGHSHPRTHRGKERFPGMTITYALMEKLEEICEQNPERAQVVTKARVFKLLRDGGGAVTGCQYEHNGETKTAHGPVVLASGGYAADLSSTGIIAKYRPDLIAKNLSTTNGEHCTGDGIKMSVEVGAGTVDLTQVQVHPTGLVDPADPDARVKFLAAEALRGTGALLLDKNGKRFANELGHRDYVSGRMWESEGPFRLVLNGACSREIEWHCKHYVGRGLMKRFESGADLAREMGISVDQLRATFDGYNEVARTKKDRFEKRFFNNVPFKVDDYFHVAVVTPVFHYTMGGIAIDGNARVLVSDGGDPIDGLYAAGEVAGGIHGVNRLGGSSLLDCVVFGRVAGATAAGDLLQNLAQGGAGGGGGSSGPFSVNTIVEPGTNKIVTEISWGGRSAAATSAASAPSSSASAPAKAAAAPEAKELREISAEEVAKHNSKDDCWVIVNGEVLDVTNFLPDHPGGAKAILLFAGRDASDEFNMLHKPDVVKKYAPECIIGVLKPGSKL